MEQYTSIDQLETKNAWVTIGSFDGVHLGHQLILKNLVQGAHAAGLPAVVFTFFPHPAVVLGKIKQPYYLTTPQERAELMGNLGVDIVITQEFSPTFASITAVEFIGNLKQKLGLSRLCVGYDFALGRNREGNVDQLRILGDQYDFKLNVIDPITMEGVKISSSQIRQHLLSGEMEAAKELLGRNYSVTGEVVRGDGRGRGLGFATANMQIWAERLMPAGGVYATWAWVGQNRYPSVTNLGTRPTFEDHPVPPRLEAHLLDVEMNLYGQEIRLEFVKQLRAEMRFPSVQELMNQVQRDIQQSREVLSYVQ